MHPCLDEAKLPRILAHRGLVTDELARQGTVENTVAAVEAALVAGADHIESDLHLTRDGRVVLFHDTDLSRIAGDPRAIASVEHRELEELMSHRGGLLTLEEALERHPDARFNFDVKATAAARPAGRLIAPHADRVLLTSFSDKNRMLALRSAAELGRASRPATSPGMFSLARVLVALAAGGAGERVLGGVDALQIPERFRGIRVLSPRLIEAAHKAGVEVHVWTVNDPERMRALVNAGVDGIVTDRADIALEVLAEYRER